MAGKIHQKYSHKIKVSSKKPLFWFLIKLRYPGKHFSDTIFSYGDTIYNGTRFPLSEEFRAHEETHVRQMYYSKFIGLPIFIWYHFSKKFRLKCELEAYQNQLEINGNKEYIARCLANPIYRNMVSYEEALKLL